MRTSLAASWVVSSFATTPPSPPFQLFTGNRTLDISPTPFSGHLDQAPMARHKKSAASSKVTIADSIFSNLKGRSGATRNGKRRYPVAASAKPVRAAAARPPVSSDGDALGREDSLALGYYADSENEEAEVKAAISRPSTSNVSIPSASPTCHSLLILINFSCHWPRLSTLKLRVPSPSKSSLLIAMR